MSAPAGGEDVPTVTVTLPVPDEACAEILCTALEGGIGYWCVADNIVRTERDADDDWRYVSFDAYDTEEPDDHFGAVTYATVRTGIQRILTGGVAVGHDIRGAILSALLGSAEEGGTYIDAQRADCVVQAGLLGEIRYG